MNELQNTILSLIKEIDAICKKYNITYYASGGTVIGAFRHDGFIPWDDDADIYMTRDNFLKFKEAFYQEAPKGRTLGSLEINPDYPGTLAHYRNDENTSFVTRYHILNSCDAGILVDIFILDPIDDNPEHWDDYIGKLRIYADLNFPFYSYTNCGDTKYLSQYFEYEKKVKKEGKYSVNKMLQQELFTFPEEKATHYILRWGTLPHVFPKEMFEEPVYVKYEDTELPMPTKWYDYLVKLYGYNWNEVPLNPADEGHVAVISTQYRYTNFLIDSDRFIDKKKNLKMYFKRKHLLIQREILRRPFIETFLNAKKDYILACQKEYIESNHIDLYDLFKKGKYEEIIKTYEIYLSHQFDQAFVGKMTHNLYNRFKNPIFIPLPDDELELLLYSLLYTCDYNRLNKLLMMRLSISSDKRFEAIQEILRKAHNIMKAFYEKNYSYVCELLSNESNDFLYAMDRITHIYYSSKMECQIPLTDDEIEFLKNKSLNDKKGYWKKIYGDYLFSLNDQKYLDKYEECLSMTNDGFVINELNHKFNLQIDYKKRFGKNKQVVYSQYQQISMKLLEDFTDILDQHHIDYFLIGDTLKYIYLDGTLPHKDSTLEIAIKPEDAKSLMEIFKNDEKFSTPLDNPQIIIHGFRYKSLDHHYLIVTSDGKVVKQDIYIKIHILRKNSPHVLKRKICNFIYLIYRVYREHQSKSLVYLASQIFMKIFGVHNVRRFIFNNYLKDSIHNSRPIYQINRRKYDEYHFNNYETLYFYSKEFKIPYDMDEFFNFKQKQSVQKSSPYNMHFFSIYLETDNLTNEEKIEEIMLSDKKKIKNYQKALGMNFKLYPYNKQARYNWNIILRSEDRFNLYLEYKDQKPEIISLYERKKYDELWIKLSDYDFLAREYLLKNLGLCFDKDIFNIYLDMLVKNDEEKIADKLKRLVPQEHLEDIKILKIDDE